LYRAETRADSRFAHSPDRSSSSGTSRQHWRGGGVPR